MTKSVLNYGASEVAYWRFGQGEQLLIAFHGFADQGALFKVLEKSLTETYVTYALDLPFHGSTKWEKSYFDQSDLNHIIDLIIKKENKTRISLMAYSMGGRLVQKILPHWIKKTDHIYLIAPDGLDTKWMFNVNSLPLPIRHLTHRLLRKPSWMIKLIKKAYHWKIISKFIHDFAYYHISTKEKRDRIFQTWYSLDRFKIYPAKVKALLKENPVPVSLYFGKRDEVIPPEAGEKISAGLSHVKTYLINEGHLLVDDKLAALLAHQLKMAPFDPKENK